jgi:hypothetical protein
MARSVFYSFHYQPDNWRAGQVRNMGVVDGNKPASDNDWETITKSGDTAIQKWIDGQLYGKSATVVLIGTNTFGRKWINYEIKSSWDSGKGLVGVHIHSLKNVLQFQTLKGRNPFEDFTITINGVKKDLSTIVKAYSPPQTDSQQAYAHIKANLAGWIEEAISIRGKY